MEEVVLLDNSVGIEIHGDGTISLDCLVEVGSHNVSWDDLSSWDFTQFWTPRAGDGVYLF